MALPSLRYEPTSDSLTVPETKGVSYICDGVLNNFREWEYRAQMRMGAALASVDPETGEPLPRVVIAAVGEVIEGFKGDAFDITMDIGKDMIVSTTSNELLIQTVRALLFPWMRRKPRSSST
eukprot:4155215-Pyramimonas_sp.AAC.1